MKREQLYLSTTADDAAAVARAHGLGLELAVFCTASNMDVDFAQYGPLAERLMAESGAKKFVFHGPFSELSPAAIDPLVRQVSEKRYLQAAALAAQYGIHRVVLHGGFTPQVYFPAWFVPQSIEVWKALLPQLPENTELLIENVMEPDPELLADVAAGVNDPRFRLCLDIGHANTRCSRRELREWIAVCAPWLGHVHIHNNDGDWDLHAPLGEGVIPMEEIVTQLSRDCPEATYTIENMHAAPSVEWLLERGVLHE